MGIALMSTPGEGRGQAIWEGLTTRCCGQTSVATEICHVNDGPNPPGLARDEQPLSGDDDRTGEPVLLEDGVDDRARVPPGPGDAPGDGPDGVPGTDHVDPLGHRSRSTAPSGPAVGAQQTGSAQHEGGGNNDPAPANVCSTHAGSMPNTCSAVKGEIEHMFEPTVLTC